MITIYKLISIIWIIFILIWLISGLTSKKTAKSATGTWFVFRLGIVIVIYILVKYTRFFPSIVNYYFVNPIIIYTGFVVTLLGIALALWARFYLGRNWGMPMSQKENAELVTSGPYKSIRHPIYSGVLLALLGSTLTLGALWGFVFIVSAIYFLISAPIEEKIMLNLFPTTYPDYKQKTKMLIPFIF